MPWESLIIFVRVADLFIMNKTKGDAPKQPSTSILVELHTQNVEDEFMYDQVLIYISFYIYTGVKNPNPKINANV